jgi:hypothetical protein
MGRGEGSKTKKRAGSAINTTGAKDPKEEI